MRTGALPAAKEDWCNGEGSAVEETCSAIRKRRKATSIVTEGGKELFSASKVLLPACNWMAK